MNQCDAWLMIRRLSASMRRSAATRFVQTGLQPISPMAARSNTRRKLATRESPRTTKLYDRTRERLTQAGVERIRF
jgi:hypothetical protein